jgi:hypothetical protein
MERVYLFSDVHCYTIASAFGEVENMLFLEEKRMQISLATQYVLLYYFVIKIVSSIIIRKKLNIILEVPIFETSRE